MQIVRAKKGDVRDISRCRRESIEKVNASVYSLEKLEVLLLNSTAKGVLEELKEEEVFCLTKDNKIIGTVSLDRNQISGIYVAPKYFDQGYSQKLLEFIEKYSKRLGLEDLYVYATIGEKDFYLHNGYSVKGIAASVPTDDPTVFIYMEKLLE